jgi:hypothetical protein
VREIPCGFAPRGEWGGNRVVAWLARSGAGLECLGVGGGPCEAFQQLGAVVRGVEVCGDDMFTERDLSALGAGWVGLDDDPRHGAPFGCRERGVLMKLVLLTISCASSCFIVSRAARITIRIEVPPKHNVAAAH